MWHVQSKNLIVLQKQKLLASTQHYFKQSKLPSQGCRCSRHRKLFFTLKPRSSSSHSVSSHAMVLRARSWSSPTITNDSYAMLAQVGRKDPELGTPEPTHLARYSAVPLTLDRGRPGQDSKSHHKQNNCLPRWTLELNKN